MIPILLVMGLSGGVAAAQVAEINAVVGDRSFRETYPAGSPAGASEDVRIATHLAWALARLRSADTRALPAPARAERARLLDALAGYRLAGRFPRRDDGVRGRRPRFVDGAGTRCAVAHLLDVSAGPDAVARVNAAHEHDYVLDMRSPELSAWAARSGLTLVELAMIQPTYDDGGSVEVPTRWEEEQARRRPRPLTTSDLESALWSLWQRDALRACLPGRAGRWAMDARVRVAEGGRRGRATVRLAPRDAPVERCLAALVEQYVANLLQSANYQWRGIVRSAVVHPLVILDPAAVDAAVRAAAVERALAACVPAGGGAGAERVVIEASGWNGQMRMIPRAPWTALPPDELARFRCMQERIGYGALPEYGLEDRQVEVDVP
jgi:hypothetical protein